jgi:hypothetical protein
VSWSARTLSALNYEGSLEWNVSSINITPEVSDIYVTATTLNGCSKEAAVRADVDGALFPHISCNE